ncbi:MAG: TIR domain-containing protein [Anaerolineae bacterium]|jgi:WD40 repeat protein|nr:TIR domain-containing protein [Anaerolineae bacterium]
MDIFVSYSRRNVDFTRVVVEKLKASEHEVWVDWEDIPYSSDWWKEITRGMDACQAVVLIVTPDFLRSDVCNKEMVYARSCNKRIIPILHQEIDEEGIAAYWREQKWGDTAAANWDTVRAHNWLFCRTEDEYEKAFKSLIQTIARDPENSHYHTRLLVRAREWFDSEKPGKGRDEGLLLRGDDLRRAESWLQFNRMQEPRPTSLHSIYIGASAALRTQEEERTQRQSRRLRQFVGLLSVLLVFALLSGAFAVNRSFVAEVNAQTAVAAQSSAVESAATAQANLLEAWQAQALYRADRSLAQIDEQRPQPALILALEALENFNQGIYTSNSQLALTRAITAEVQETAYFPNDSAVNSAIWSSDRQRVATLSAFTLSVWNTADGTLVAEVDHASSTFLRGAVFTSDGQKLLSWDSDGVVRLWDLATEGTPAFIMRHEPATLVNGAHFSPDETRILSASDDGRAILWDAATGEALAVMPHNNGVSGAAFSADGARILTWGRDRAVKVWDLRGGLPELEATFIHDAYVRGATFNRDQTRVLSWSRGQRAYVWRMDTPKEPLFSYTHDAQVNTAAFNQTETEVLTASMDGTARIWSAITGSNLATMTHTGSVDSAVYSGDEQRIVTVTSDRELVIWRSGQPDLPEHTLTSAATQRAWVNNNATRIVTWSQDSAKLWLMDQTPVRALEMRHNSDVYGAVWDEASRRVLTWGDDRTARLWRVGTSGEPRQLTDGRRTNGVALDALRARALTWDSNVAVVRSVLNPLEQPLTFSHDVNVEGGAWAPAGGRLATWTDGGTQVWVWSVDFPEDAPLRLSHTRRIAGVVWSRNGRVLATWDAGGITGAGNSTVTIWTIGVGVTDSNGGMQRLILPHDELVGGVILHPEGAQALTWAGSGAFLWSLTGGDNLTLSHDGPVLGAQFNADGSAVLSWGADNTVRLWDASTGELRATFTHSGAVNGARFSRDEQRLLTWSTDSTARIWSVAEPDSPQLTFTNEVVLQGQSFPQPVISASWNTDESRLMALAVDGVVRVWALTGETVGQPPVVLNHEADPIREALWSDDGARILTWDDIRTVRVWEVNQAYRSIILPHSIGLRGALWSADPTRVLTWGSDGARLWLVDIPSLIALGEGQRVRDLVNEERTQLVLPTLTPTMVVVEPTQTPLPTLTPSPTPRS